MRVLALILALSETSFTRAETPVYQGFRVVGAAGFEPVTCGV